MLVTPGISALEYANRRAKLAAKLPPDSIAIVAASDVKYRSGAVFYEFHQDPDFFYLTGFDEPQAAAVIERTGPDGQHVFHLFVRPKDAKAELWEGTRSGMQAALDVFNADETGDINQIQSLLGDVITDVGEVYTNLVANNSPPSQFSKFFSRSPTKTEGLAAILGKRKVKPLRSFMNELRAFKSDAEVANMRIAGKASGRAHTNAMRRRFSSEKELAAFLEYQFKENGCDSSAYVPVVAGGENALSIHYVRNDDILRKVSQQGVAQQFRLTVHRDGQLVLADAGGEYAGYVTDITRCWPVNGRYSPAQRDMYEAILSVQRSCVSLCREDANMTLAKLHDIAESGLRDGLKQLGFDMTTEALRTLFPHHVGHYIGLDLHDTPGYSRREPLRTSHCITIEPGIYVPDDDRWPEAFRGMAIQIEDSICVCEDGPLILSTEAVKEVVDIEALAL